MYFTINKFKKARMAAGITQKDAAERIGVSAITILQWEKGKNVPNKTNLPKIAEAYGCTVEDLIGNEVSA